MWRIRTNTAKAKEGMILRWLLYNWSTVDSWCITLNLISALIPLCHFCLLSPTPCPNPQPQLPKFQVTHLHSNTKTVEEPKAITTPPRTCLNFAPPLWTLTLWNSLSSFPLKLHSLSLKLSLSTHIFTFTFVGESPYPHRNENAEDGKRARLILFFCLFHERRWCCYPRQCSWQGEYVIFFFFLALLG